MNQFSKYALICSYLIMGYTAFFFYPKWEQNREEATISWDVSGYYFYLPALFVYHDIKHFSFKDTILKKYGPTPEFQQGYIHEKSGNCVMKYSSGQAIAMLPWFGVAHLWAKNSKIYSPDGFSFPYQFCIGAGMFIYSIIGLYFLRKVLLKYFKDSTVGITLLLLVMGTNYLNYSSIDQAMTHNTLFSIYVLILWFSLAYYSKPTIMKAFLIGLFCGFATLIRPTDIISLLIPFLIGINTLAEIKNRFHFIYSHLLHAILLFVGFASIVSVQPIYWKLVSGNWVVYSYQNVGFDWLKPHINDYLFSYRCGWIRYCPMMMLPFLGFIPYYFRKENRFLLFYLYL